MCECNNSVTHDCGSASDFHGTLNGYDVYLCRRCQISFVQPCRLLPDVPVLNYQKGGDFDGEKA